MCCFRTLQVSSRPSTFAEFHLEILTAQEEKSYPLKLTTFPSLKTCLKTLSTYLTFLILTSNVLVHLFRQDSRSSLDSFPVMSKPLKTASYEGYESWQNIHFTFFFREHLLRICCTPEISGTNIKETDAELHISLILILWQRRPWPSSSQLNICLFNYSISSSKFLWGESPS